MSVLDDWTEVFLASVYGQNEVLYFKSENTANEFIKMSAHSLANHSVARIVTITEGDEILGVVNLEHVMTVFKGNDPQPADIPPGIPLINEDVDIWR